MRRESGTIHFLRKHNNFDDVSKREMKEAANDDTCFHCDDINNEGDESELFLSILQLFAFVFYLFLSIALTALIYQTTMFVTSKLRSLLFHSRAAHPSPPIGMFPLPPFFWFEMLIWRVGDDDDDDKVLIWERRKVA